MCTVGVTGFEPAALCSQSRCATKLRYTPYSVHYHWVVVVEPLEGVEPSTVRLQGGCSAS